MTGERGAALPRARWCRGCGRAIKPGELAVRDVGQSGIDIYHQRCAPTLRLQAGRAVYRSRPRPRGLGAIWAAIAMVVSWAFHRRRTPR